MFNNTLRFHLVGNLFLQPYRFPISLRRNGNCCTWCARLKAMDAFERKIFVWQKKQLIRSTRFVVWGSEIELGGFFRTSSGKYPPPDEIQRLRTTYYYSVVFVFVLLTFFFLFAENTISACAWQTSKSVRGPPSMRFSFQIYIWRGAMVDFSRSSPCQNIVDIGFRREIDEERGVLESHPTPSIMHSVVRFGERNVTMWRAC